MFQKHLKNQAASIAQLSMERHMVAVDITTFLHWGIATRKKGEKILQTDLKLPTDNPVNGGRNALPQGRTSSFALG